jgi:hypothetical protein
MKKGLLKIVAILVLPGAIPAVAIYGAYSLAKKFISDKNK